MILKKALYSFLVLLGSLLTLVVYWPGLSGPFLLDDFANLDALGKSGGVRGWETFKAYVFGNTSGPGGRSLSMLSFLINDDGWPSNPFLFKYTNLLLHLLNGLLLGGLFYQLIRNLWPKESENRAILIALFTATLWLLHPFHVSTTLYVIQRMTILSALFSITGLLIYVKGRSLLVSHPQQAYFWMTLSVTLFTPLAFFSKENGALLPLLIFVMEYSVLRHFALERPKTSWVLIFLVLPNLLLILYFAIRWNIIMEGYQIRSFTLGERMLTEARILLQYLHQILFPKLGSSGIYNESLVLSHGLLNPPTTLIAVLAIINSLWAGWWLRIRYPFLTLAIFFFFTGHLLESTFIPLELYFEHRNYLPSIFIFLPMTTWLIKKTEERKEIFIIPILMISLLIVLTYHQTSLWGDQKKLAAYWAKKNPHSIRAQRAFAIEMESSGHPELALSHLDKTIRLYPDNFELWLHRISILCYYYKPGSEDFSKLLQLAQNGLYEFRTYSLLESFIKKIIEGHCHNINSTYAHELLNRLQKNRAALEDPGPKRQIHHLQGLVYLKEQHAMLALKHFIEAQHIFPDMEAGLLQVSLLATGRMFVEALELLKLLQNHLEMENKTVFKEKKSYYTKEVMRLNKSLLEDLQKIGNLEP